MAEVVTERNFVQGSGSLKSRIMLIGEAPGTVENELKKPFVGPSGELLDRWWFQAGLKRGDVRIDNVYPYQPPEVKGKPKNDIKTVPKDELAFWIDDLHDRITKLKDPWVLVPVGNTALNALTGKTGITHWRGSVMQYVDRAGREIKVIPSLHPASTFRKQSFTKRCILDWKRIADDATFRELRLPQREHVIAPTKKIIQEYYETCRAEATEIAGDIETPGGTMTCMGFSWRSDLSLTIPLDDMEFWGTEENIAWAFAMVTKFCQLPQPKIFQNGLFDNYWLWLYRIKVINWIWDTLAMHHCLDSTDSNSLEYMASIDTREPYWKVEAKGPDESSKYTRDKRVFWRYNGKDCAVDYELFELYKERLIERDLLPFYELHYRQMFQPLLHAMLTGVPMDDKKRRSTLLKYIVECMTIQSKIETLAGKSLSGPKSISATKVSDYLYNDLQLPKQIDRKTKNPTTKEIALRRLNIKLLDKIENTRNVLPLHEKGSRAKAILISNISRWQLGARITNLVLEHRRKYQLSTFLPDTRVDPDSVMRTSYNFSTETGRLSSSKCPTRTGGNLQNIDRELRNIFVPPAGHYFLEVDLSQVEWRIMTMLTHDAELMRLGRSQPYEFDIHNYSASIVFQLLDALVKRTKTNLNDLSAIASLLKPIITPMQRYLGKRVTHACLTPEHQVLTPQGWIPIDQWKGQQIAVWDTNEQIEFEVPSKHHTYDFEGLLHDWKGDKFSQIVTPEHQFAYQIGRPDITRNQYRKGTSKYLFSSDYPVSFPTGNGETRAAFAHYQTYRGKVYCFTTSTGYFLVRHNGSVSVTGNSSYGMTGNKLAEILLLDDGIIRTTEECQEMINNYMTRFPAIRLWQSRIIERIRETRKLTNSWGRTIFFEWDHMEDDLFRRGFAFGPQSENAALLNQYGLIPVYNFRKREKLQFSINAQVHDSLLMAIPYKLHMGYHIAKFAIDSLQQPHEYEGEVLCCPATTKVGMSWKGDHEFKKFPTEEEYNEVVDRIYKEAV